RVTPHCPSYQAWAARETACHDRLQTVGLCADVGRRHSISAPERLIEMGQVAETALERDGADELVRLPQVGQHVMRALEALVEDEFGERRAFRPEQGPHVARGDMMCGRRGVG